MKDSKIEWTHYMWLSPEPFAPFKFALISNAIRLKVPQFVTLVTKRNAVAHLESEFWELGKRLDVMRSKIAAATITTILACELVSVKDRRPPSLIFGNASVIQIAYRLAMLVSIVFFAAWRSLFGNLANLTARFFSMLLPNSIRWAILCRFAHFSPGFGAHLFPFHWRDKGLFTPFPSFAHFLFRFFGMGHRGIIHSTHAINKKSKVTKWQKIQKSNGVT